MWLILPAGLSPSLSGMIPTGARGELIWSMNPTTGCLSWTRTTYLLTVAMDSTGFIIAALAPTFAYRSNEAFTSCAVISCPLWKRTPSRR